jgi:CRISPR-associated protein Csx14
MPPTTLIATLGAEPQVITLTVQLLCQAGEPLGRVVVLHTQADRPPVAQALPALVHHFGQRAGWPSLQTVTVPVADVLAPAELDAFATALYTVVRTWVAERGRVHLLLAGGRKSMAMLGMSVAQLLLGPEDRVWYLHSDEALRTSGRMEMAPGDGAQLIRIPLAQRTPAPPVLTRSFRASTPADALDELQAESARRVAHFLEAVLTAAEREVAILLAHEVLTVKEIAARLHKSPKTVTNQLSAVYEKLEAEFGLEPDVGVKREFLRRVVGVRAEFRG